MQRQCGFFDLQISKERMQYGQPLIERTDCAVAFMFQVVEKGADQPGIDLLEREFFNSDALYIPSKSKQQHKDVTIRLDGIWAQISLTCKVMAKEVTDMPGKCCWLHDHLPCGITPPNC